jgi:hypothetical protein
MRLSALSPERAYPVRFDRLLTKHDRRKRGFRLLGQPELFASTVQKGFDPGPPVMERLSSPVRKLDFHPKYREHQEGGPERRLQAGNGAVSPRRTDSPHGNITPPQRHMPRWMVGSFSSIAMSAGRPMLAFPKPGWCARGRRGDARPSVRASTAPV